MENIDFTHGGDVYKYKKNLIDFSSNINPLGLSKSLKNILIRNIENIQKYPDTETTKLRKEIAKFWRIDKENVLCGNGSVDLIYLIVQCLKPEKVLIPSPTFSEYERAAKITGSKIEFLNLEEDKGFSLNTEFEDEKDLIFLGNPNNPTGNLLIKDKREIEKIKCRCIVIDETFIDFLEEQNNLTFIREAAKGKNIIVLRSFTKFFAIPGLRIGYLVANKEVVNNLKKYQIPWCVNSFAQSISLKHLYQKNYINNTLLLIKKERDFLFQEISKIPGLKPYPSVTNFLLIKIENENVNSTYLKEKLVKYGILIRDCSNFRNLGERFIRLSVRRHSENVKLINLLKRILCKNLKSVEVD